MENGWLGAGCIRCNDNARCRGQPSRKTEHKTAAHWQIGAVDASANTVEFSKSDSSSNLTVRVTAATHITINGKTAKLDELKDGMKVSFSVSGGSCSQIAASIPKTDKRK